MALIIRELWGHAALQDAGRRGRRHVGVPESGPFDRVAWQLANAVVGNGEPLAAIELAFGEIALESTEHHRVGVVGAAERVWVDDLAFPARTALTIGPGSTLRIAGPAYGARTQIAVEGGFRALRELRDVAAATDMTRTNAFRMLQTLRELGYVDQTEDGAQYSLTLRLFEIGARRRASDTLVQVAHPVLQRLSGLVPENVMLSMREGMTSVVVDRIESRAFVRTFAYLGARAPLHAVSGGKCILAFESDEVIAEAEKTLTRFTERTITDPARLREELAQIRDRGYATAYHEVNDAARGVAVPIRSRFGRVAAAISISGPMPGYGPDLVEEYVRHLKTHAAMIEEAWVEGWRQPVASVPRPSSA